MKVKALYAVQFADSKLIKVGRSHRVDIRIHELEKEHKQKARRLFVLDGQGHREHELILSLRPFRWRSPWWRGGGSGPREIFRPVPSVIRILDEWHRSLSGVEAFQ